MYKVCFADDEIMNHQLLEKLVDWKAMGFMIAGAAADGAEALQLYEKERPDLFLLDIRMPFIDGLECARLIREADRSVKIAIVSAYDDFTYAQKAIQYDVQDFIVKPVSRIVLNRFVKKMKEALDGEKAELQEKKKPEEEFRRLLRELRETGAADQETKTDPMFLKNVVQAGCLRVIKKDGGVPEYELLERWRKKAENRGGKESALTADFVLEIPGKIFVLSRCAGALENIVRSWEPEWENVCMDWSLSQTPLHAGEVIGFLREASYAENPGFYSETGTIFRENRRSPYRQVPKMDMPREIYGYLHDGEAFLQIEQYFERLAELCEKNRTDPALLKEYALDLLVLVKLRLKELYAEKAFYILREVRIDELRSIEKAFILKNYMRRVLNKLSGGLEKLQEEGGRDRKLIRMANEYAQEHFTDSAFSVSEVARHVGLSKNYFVTFYKENAGISFWEYVTRIRIEKARQLLQTTDWTGAVIAENVGYESEYHFSRKFKEITGMPPSKYRKSE